LPSLLSRSLQNAVTVSPAEIVCHTIRNAKRIRREPKYEWPTARAALLRILADLESRTPEDESLKDLRAFIAEGDRGLARDDRQE
jgi:hypothetical protein